MLHLPTFGFTIVSKRLFMHNLNLSHPAVCKKFLISDRAIYAGF